VDTLNKGSDVGNEYLILFTSVSKLFIRMELPNEYSSDTIYIKVEAIINDNGTNNYIGITEGIDTEAKASVTFPWCFKNENDPGYLYLSTSFIKDYPGSIPINGLRISIGDSSGAMVENWSK
jgi:hypothetical protein